MWCVPWGYGNPDNQLWFIYGSCYRNGIYEPKLRSDHGMFLRSCIKKYGMPLPAIIIGEFVINIIFFGFIALGAPTAIQDVITGLALLIIITVTTKATKGEIVK